jgi:hypothetical protein
MGLHRLTHAKISLNSAGMTLSPMVKSWVIGGHQRRRTQGVGHAHAFPKLGGRIGQMAAKRM